MTEQVQNNKRVVAPMTIVGWVTIGLILAFAYAVYRGSESISNIQKEIAVLDAYADSTLRDSTAFMQPADVKILVDTSTRETFDTYVSTQGNLLAILAVLMTVIVIVIPLILNNNIREINEEWFRKKVEDAEKNMNEELQKGLKKMEDQSSAGVTAIETQINKQKSDIEGHQTKIDEQAKTVARQAEDIKILKENIEKITNDYKLEVEHGESLKQVEKKDSRKEKIKYLEDEIKKNKENYPASGFYELGKLYFEEREYEKSISSFEIAVDKKPDYVEAYQALSEAYLIVDNLEMAWKKIEQGIRIRETSSLLETRSRVFFKMGLYEDAKKDVIRSIELALKEGGADRKGNLEKLMGNIETEIQKQKEEDADRVITIGEAVFRMKKVAGGAFLMGAAERDPEAFEDEKPAHRVLLYDYYIGETAVTQALWKAVMGTDPSYFKGNYSLPVECVSWDECQEFVEKLNDMTGLTFRLPTEAEWEYAARGGNKSKGYKYSGSNDIDEVAWYWENSGDEELSGRWNYDKIMQNNCKTHPVKSKKPNELGLYDMSGNVWEWCQDWKGSYNSSEQTNLQGDPSFNYLRVLRGGSWYYIARDCRVSLRYGHDQDYKVNRIGFRLVLPGEPLICNKMQSKVVAAN